MLLDCSSIVQNLGIVLIKSTCADFRCEDARGDLLRGSLSQQGWKEGDNPFSPPLLHIHMMETSSISEFCN